MSEPGPASISPDRGDALEERPSPTLGMRIQVMQRRFRYAALVSRLSGRSLEDAWRIFRPLPAPDGVWGVPSLDDAAVQE